MVTAWTKRGSAPAGPRLRAAAGRGAPAAAARHPKPGAVEAIDSETIGARSRRARKAAAGGLAAPRSFAAARDRLVPAPNVSDPKREQLADIFGRPERVAQRLGVYVEWRGGDEFAADHREQERAGRQPAA